MLNSQSIPYTAITPDPSRLLSSRAKRTVLLRLGELDAVGPALHRPADRAARGVRHGCFALDSAKVEMNAPPLHRSLTSIWSSESQRNLAVGGFPTPRAVQPPCLKTPSRIFLPSLSPEPWGLIQVHQGLCCALQPKSGMKFLQAISDTGLKRSSRGCGKYPREQMSGI